MWSNFQELVLFLLADLLAEKTCEVEVSVLSAHYSRLVNIMQEKADGRGHAYLENKTIVQVSQKLRALETEHACNKYLFRQQIRPN